MILLPHSPFCDVVVDSFTSKSVITSYSIQIVDFLLIMVVIWFIENYKRITIFHVIPVPTTYTKLPNKSETELSENIL